MYNEDTGEFYLENLEKESHDQVEKIFREVGKKAAEKLIENYESIDLKTIELQI